MIIREINDAITWDTWLVRGSYAPFTQAWTWGEFQVQLGKRVRRLAVFLPDQELPCAMVQWVCESRRGLLYWFAPGGPVLFADCFSPQERHALLSLILTEHRTATSSLNTIFDRCEPRILLEKSAESFLTIDFPIPTKRVKSINPSINFVVDLRGTTDEVLERMHKKTRYNIRLAERHGIIVRGGTMDDLPIFFSLLRETAERDGFISHNETYLRRTYEVLSKTGMARLRIAEQLGVPLAASMEIVFGDTVTYLHGASSSQQREQMPPYALQWSAIFAAIQDGHRWYDFGGGNPEEINHPDYRETWEGVTRFKERWGAQRMMTPGTYDLPRMKWVYEVLVRR